MDAEIRPNVPINGKLYFDFQGWPCRPLHRESM